MHCYNINKSRRGIFFGSPGRAKKSTCVHMHSQRCMQVLLNSSPDSGVTRVSIT